MFRGRHDHVLDKKGRLSIPASYRLEIQRRSEKPPVITAYDDHLTLTPADDFERLEAWLATQSDLSSDVAAYQRFVASGTEDCPFDTQGRITIPKRMRDQAQLTHRVTVAGVLEKIEIWDTELYEEDRRRTLDRLPEIKQRVEDQRGHE